MFNANNIFRITIFCLPVFLIACDGSDNGAEVEALESRADGLNSRIATLQTEKTELSEMVADIQMQLAAADNSAEIDALSARLDELEERLNTVVSGVTLKYMITMTNITNNQPLSPILVALHSAEFSYWKIGEPADPLLERLAESGDASLYLDSIPATAQNITGATLMPGESTSMMLDAAIDGVTYLQGELNFTIASMAVNTNDAFSGMTNWNIASLKVGESTSAILPIYDAGTEANTETADSMPGPAAGGQGYNAIRDDIEDRVTRHPGVVTADDGYAESALDQSHRFDQGALLVKIDRVATL